MPGGLVVRLKHIFLFYLILCSVSFSQNIEAVKLGEKIIEDGTAEELNSLITAGNFSPSLYDLLYDSNIISELLENYESESSAPEYVLFFNGCSNRNDIRLFEYQTGKPQRRFVESENTVLIWLDDSAGDIYQMNITVESEESQLFNNVRLSRGLFNQSGTPTSDDDGKFFINAYQYNNTGPAPGGIEITMKQIVEAELDSDAYKSGNFDQVIGVDRHKIYFYSETKSYFKNVERFYFGLSIGASVVAVDEILLEPDKFNPSVITAQQDFASEWKGEAMLLLVLMPGVESDFNAGIEFWSARFYEDILKRFSINAGIEMSETPFDRLFLGIGFNLVGALDILFGAAWSRLPDDQSTITLNEVASYDDIIGLFPQTYELGPFIGISLKASRLFKIF